MLRADATSGCWPLLTLMLFSWLRTICVLLLAAIMRIKVLYTLESFVCTFTKLIDRRIPSSTGVRDVLGIVRSVLDYIIRCLPSDALQRRRFWLTFAPEVDNAVAAVWHGDYGWCRERLLIRLNTIRYDTIRDGTSTFAQDDKNWRKGTNNGNHNEETKNKNRVA